MEPSNNTKMEVQENYWNNKFQRDSFPLKSLMVRENESHDMCVDDKRIILNIGGVRHEILQKNLKKFPQTRLGQLIRRTVDTEILSLCDGYTCIVLKDDNMHHAEYFFDRLSSTCFGSILNFYRTGQLHLSHDVCVMAFTEELEFWGIDNFHLAPCCHSEYHQRMDHILNEYQHEEMDRQKDQGDSDHQGNKCWVVKLKKYLWHLFESPSSSIAARVIAVVSILFIILSTITLTLGTVPGLMDHECVNGTRHCDPDSPVKVNTTEKEVNLVSQLAIENRHLTHVEYFCMTWFTLEYLLRLWSCPDRLKFFRSVLNNIDLLVILPFYISITIVQSNVVTVQGGLMAGQVDQILQVFRLLRILRILKLARHSTGLQCLGFTLRNSMQEVGLLVMFMLIGVLIFSSVEYFVEKEHNELFSSIPATFWWAIITMTTVGYGDMYPTTVVGKIVAGICCVCGVLMIAMPIPIIVNNFDEFYKIRVRRERALKRRQAMAIAVAAAQQQCDMETK